MNWDAIGAIGQMGGMIVVAGAIWRGFRGVRRQMWLQTFTHFTQRYGEIIERLPNYARVPGEDADLRALDPDERSSILAALRQYFNLCSEEHYLAGVRILDQQTWGIWTVGIKDSMRNSVFRDGWKLLRAEYEFYPTFCSFMDHLAATSSSPSGWPPVRSSRESHRI